MLMRFSHGPETIKLGDLEVRRLGFGAMRLPGKEVWGEPKDPATAHAVVRRAIELGSELEQLSLAELQSFSTLFAEDVHIALSLEQTLRSKSQTGGTSPEVVASAISQARSKLL